MKAKTLTVVAGILLAATAAGAAPKEAESMFDAQTYRPLVSEDKAFRVGDILTVIVQEVATAMAATDSRADRKTSVAGDIGSSKVGIVSGSAGASTESEGGGRTQRSGRLAAQLSVRVVEVAPNGDLVVYGHQDITVNGEDQTITLRGVVRPRDIGENNTIVSGRIAEAAIQFRGEGFITEKSKPGWITQLLTWVGF